MLPILQNGIGTIDFPSLPPSPSGPHPSSPGKFSRLYDQLQLGTEKEASPIRLPTAMEVRPDIEFPGAVDPDGLRLPISSLSKGTGAALDGGQTAGLPEFLAPFKKGLDEVNQLQKQAETLGNEAALGGDVDLHDVMIATEKAGVAIQLTLQVRNKLVEAYQDVMRMQV